MNYKKHLKKGFISILKNILKDICEFGIKDAALTITFSTDNKYVVVSDRIKWPDQMKIFLSDGSFEDLRVYDTFFEIVLYFDDQEELLKVPYIFVTKIEDSDNDFELDFSDIIEENDFYITNENIINIDFEKNSKN